MGNGREQIQRRQLPSRRICLFLLGAAESLSGCGILQPVDMPNTSLLVPMTAGTKSQDGTPHNDCPDFAAGLDQIICAADQRRLELQSQAAQVTNNKANFNALTWPLIGGAIYYQALNSEHRLLLPAAIATGLYGFFNSGIPGRDTIHRDAARGLACAIVEANGDAYLRTQYEKNPDGQPVALQPALENLDKKIAIASLKWTKFSDEHLNHGKSERRKPQDSIDRLLDWKDSRAAKGFGNNTRQALEKHVQDRLADVIRILKDGEQIEQSIATRAAWLSGAWVAVEQRREAQLAKNGEALRDPLEEAKKVVQAYASLTNLAIAQGKEGSAQKDSGAPAHPGILPLPPELKTGLNAASKQELRVFQHFWETDLRQAITDVRYWLNNHNSRLEKVKQTKLALGCPAEVAIVVASPPRGIDSGRAQTPVTPNISPLPSANNSR